MITSQLDSVRKGGLIKENIDNLLKNILTEDEYSFCYFPEDLTGEYEETLSDYIYWNCYFGTELNYPVTQAESDKYLEFRKQIEPQIAKYRSYFPPLLALFSAEILILFS